MCIECIGSPSTIRHCTLRASAHALDINIVHNHDNYSELGFDSLIAGSL